MNPKKNPEAAHPGVAIEGAGSDVDNAAMLLQGDDTVPLYRCAGASEGLAMYGVAPCPPARLLDDARESCDECWKRLR